MGIPPFSRNKKVLPDPGKTHKQADAFRTCIYMNDLAGLSVPRLKNLFSKADYMPGCDKMQVRSSAS